MVSVALEALLATPLAAEPDSAGRSR
jgi:hypothetical protein